jgi:hypothetical protein
MSPARQSGGGAVRVGVFLTPAAARAAYQVGVLQVLVDEAGIGFDIIAASSVGALNGAFVATGQVDRMVEEWSRWRARDVLRFRCQPAGDDRAAEAGTDNDDVKVLIHKLSIQIRVRPPNVRPDLPSNSELLERDGDVRLGDGWSARVGTLGRGPTGL